MSNQAKPRVRCAVYTRKSSEEGLEQEYNSLDAQRDACEAYIRSQKHEGWVALADHYDDGGISGATMERPALAQLLRDIEAKKVDIIVVYKVDRLTRSLSDFVKMVEVFERAKVSFVSVTQQFNTATSMGRLTLNMLLSFAQFEREVTGERIRDKIAASKKRGMWMGGYPPLGYDPRDRHLVVNQPEAETVRHIYRRYLALGSVRMLQEELAAHGIVSKVRVHEDGRRTGGEPLLRGALYLILQNPIYRGRIRHKDVSYPGEHEAIVDEELWEGVQKLLSENRVERKLGIQAKEPSLLAGMVWDESGDRLTAVSAQKNGRRYRYYVSQALIKNVRKTAPDSLRVAAEAIERTVGTRLTAFLEDPASLHDCLGAEVPDARGQQKLTQEATALSEKWCALPVVERRRILVVTRSRVIVGLKSIEIHMDGMQLRRLLLSEQLDVLTEAKAAETSRSITLSTAFDVKPSGPDARVVIEPGASGNRRRAPDPNLVRLLAQAQRYHALFLRGGRSISEMANEMGVTRSLFTRILRVSFLAPAITRAILLGRQPDTLSASTLAHDTRFPILWKDQLTALGFA